VGKKVGKWAKIFVGFILRSIPVAQTRASSLVIVTTTDLFVISAMARPLS